MKKKILIIEDEQTLIKALLESFKDEYEVETAIDGEQGWEMAKKVKPDLILLDLILPKMDGFAVLSKIKDNEATNKIPVIILTNLSDVAEKCQELGANKCLVKSDETIEAIKEVVRESVK